MDIFEEGDYVDFMTRYSDPIRRQLSERSYIKAGKILNGDAAIVYIPRDRIDETLQDLGPSYFTMFPVVLGLLSSEDLTASGIMQIQQQPYLDLTGRGVLVGFVDTGIDYTNPAFIDDSGATKIKSIWDQTIPGAAPESYDFGSEYSEEMINTALSSQTPDAIVPHKDTVGHGTYMASVACGKRAEGYVGAAPDSEIIMVKMRKADRYHLERNLVPADQQEAYSSSEFMLGVQYIVDKARALGRPLVLCVGVGSNDAGHDGTNVMEEYLARIANGTGIVVCAAAGNEAIAKHHTQGRIVATGETAVIEIRSENPGADINLMVWNGISDRISAAVTSPAGEQVSRVPARAGASLRTNLLLSDTNISIEYFFPNPRSGSQLTWIKIRNAPPGIWRVSLYGDIIVEGGYHAWMPMTDFIDPGVEFLLPMPNYTITVPGTAVGLLTVGAYHAQTNRRYAESSWGPTRLPMQAPDLVAPGVNVGGLSINGPTVRSGTSVSTAITAGACALMLQWGIVDKNEIGLNTHLVSSYLIRGCDRDAGITYPNEQWGYGRLNLYNAFVQLREIEMPM